MANGCVLLPESIMVMFMFMVMVFECTVLQMPKCCELATDLLYPR